MTPCMPSSQDIVMIVHEFTALLAALSILATIMLHRKVDDIPKRDETPQAPADPPTKAASA